MKITQVICLLMILSLSSCNIMERNEAEQIDVSFRWENWDPSDRTFLEKQRVSLRNRGAEVGSVKETKLRSKGIPTIGLILIGSTAISILAETIVSSIKSLKQCGILVDARDKEIINIKTCDLNNGELAYVTPDGRIVKIPASTKPSIGIEMLKVIFGRISF